jgi:hypothetical protein
MNLWGERSQDTLSCSIIDTPSCLSMPLPGPLQAYNSQAAICRWDWFCARACPLPIGLIDDVSNGSIQTLKDARR